jgi:hypothetical protein
MALQNRTPQNSGGLGDLAALLGLFTGSESTQTTQTQLSQEAMNSMLKSALESNRGLAAVSSGQRQSGMYNSSTNQLLTNDLLSRLTGEIAQRSAPTVQKTSSPAKIDPMMGVGGLLLLQSLFPGDSGAAASGGGTKKSATGEVGGNFFSNLGDTVSNAVSSVGNAASGIGDGVSNLLSSLMGTNNIAGVGSVGTIYSPADIFSGATLGSPATSLSFDKYNPDGYMSLASDSPTDFYSSKKAFDMSGGSDVSFDPAGIPWTAGLGSLSQGDLGGALGNIGLSTTGSLFAQALGIGGGPLGWLFGSLLGSLFS